MISKIKSYTESKHTVYATVSGVEAMQAGGQAFTPARITVHYDWRTQLDDVAWKLGNIEISGPWVGGDTEGSGHVILWPGIAPQWARDFAENSRPTQPGPNG